MAKAQYDNTVHDDEFHYNAKIAAKHADRQALVAARRNVADDLKRVFTKLSDQPDEFGRNFAKLSEERGELEREARRLDAAIKDHDNTEEDA